MDSNNKGGEKVQVLTAGGASNVAVSGKKKKKKRNQKKEHVSADAATTAAATSELSAASNTVDLQNSSEPTNTQFALELEHSEREHDEALLESPDSVGFMTTKEDDINDALLQVNSEDPIKMDHLYEEQPSSQSSDLFWLFLCFIGIMASFVCYGLLLEYTTSGGRKLHELSFLFVTSGLYTLTAAAGRYVRAETPTTIPPARFAILGLTSMGSTFCSVRSLR
jgi:hypothetical protein